MLVRLAIRQRAVNFLLVKTMSFSATKREWSELYTLLKLLSDGFAHEGTAGLPSCNDLRRIPVARILRQEHDGARNYIVDGDSVRISGKGIDKMMPRSSFASAAERILAAINEAQSDELESPDGIEQFLDDIFLYDLEAKTNDRTDLSVSFHDKSVPPAGMIVRSRLGKMPPLLDGGRLTNIKYALEGGKLSTPAVAKVNAFGNDDDVLGRIRMLAGMGCTLKYDDIADKIFRFNLAMIDLRFPRFVGEMVKLMVMENIVRIDELTRMLESSNPHKIKSELIEEHGYYRHKVKEFLLAIVAGLRPTKAYKGIGSAVKGMFLVDAEGNIHAYHQGKNEVFADFLFANTRLERSSTKKDKYGYVERENGMLYFKLNLKIGLLKR